MWVNTNTIHWAILLRMDWLIRNLSDQSARGIDSHLYLRTSAWIKWTEKTYHGCILSTCSGFLVLNRNNWRAKLGNASSIPVGLPPFILLLSPVVEQSTISFQFRQCYASMMLVKIHTLLAVFFHRILFSVYVPISVVKNINVFGLYFSYKIVFRLFFHLQLQGVIWKFVQLTVDKILCFL